MSFIGLLLIFLTFTNVIASEYRFSLIDEEKTLRTEIITKKPLENNYTGVVLERLIGHFDQFKDATDWRSRTDENFSSSVWGFISNEIVAAVTKESRHGITAYGKDPSKIMTYGEGYLSVENYSGANWNALLLMNVINQILYFDAQDDQTAINTAVELLQNEYGENYQTEISLAASDIKIYATQLKLYKCLQEEKAHIVNVTLGEEKSKQYLDFKESESGELQQVTIKDASQPVGILHIKLPEHMTMANGFRVNEGNKVDSYYTIDFNDIDTSKVENMDKMFYQCGKLTSLDMLRFNTGNVTSMQQMFEFCLNLTSLDLSSFETRKVTNMSSMFGGCCNLISLDLSKLDTNNVTNMSSMFGGCYSLTSLDLSNFETRKVTNMRNMFFGCCNLIFLDLSKFDTNNVTNMSGMFKFCLNLTSLDLSNFETRDVTNMSGMFGYCQKLRSLNLSTFNTRNVVHMAEIFCGCENLSHIQFSANTDEEVQELYKFIDYENMQCTLFSNSADNTVQKRYEPINSDKTNDTFGQTIITYGPNCSTEKVKELEEKLKSYGFESDDKFSFSGEKQTLVYKKMISAEGSTQ